MMKKTDGGAHSYLTAAFQKVEAMRDRVMFAHIFGELPFWPMCERKRGRGGHFIFIG
jgi:hypothetical protein